MCQCSCVSERLFRHSEEVARQDANVSETGMKDSCMFTVQCVICVLVVMITKKDGIVGDLNS